MQQPSSPLPVVQFFGGIFVLMGLCVGGRGLWRWCRWDHGTGKVIDYVPAAGEDDAYYPRIRVSNCRGGAVEFVSAVGGGKAWKIGAKVFVLYRRTGDDAAEGEVVSRFVLWIFPACCLLFGGLLLVAKTS